MPVYEPEPKAIEVRGDSTMGNKLLFKFIPSNMEFKLKQRGVTYIVKLNDLLAFANKSERDVFRVEAIIEDNDDQ